jgi:hypothetical protein
MCEDSPQLALISGCTHLAPLDALKKRPRQLSLSGMALAVDGAKIEKLIAKSIALLLERKNALQGNGEFAQARSFRPSVFFSLITHSFRKKAAAAARALVEAGQQLFAEGSIQRVQLLGIDLIARVHRFCFPPLGGFKATSAA